MPIELSWMIPDQILLYRWFGDISDEDLRVVIEELKIIFDTAPRPVHTIVDTSEAEHVSSDLLYIYMQSPVPTHPRCGRIAIVSGSFEAQAITDMINQLSQREMFRLFDSRASARDFLLSHDTPPPTLGPPPNDDGQPASPLP
jgi:hypothetical protein